MELIGQKSLKARMEEGDVLFGTFYKFNSPQMTEMLGLAGFDFLLVDGEHSTYSYSEMQDTVRTANGVGMHAVIRVPSGLPEHVLHACDLGAQGVQVPGLHSPEEAAAVTDEMRFYPVGHRGFGLTTRAAKYGFCDGDAFMKWSNNDLLCVVMVETLDMVSRLDELCRNPEIDVLFVGPGDLSQEVGKPGQTQCPEVLDLAKKINDAALAAGKKSGMFCGTFQDVERAIGWGMQYIAYSSDLSMLCAAFKQTAGALRELKKSAGK